MTSMDNKWVALLRGINVGGANRVPMAELRALAEALGWSNPQTYIASGNLVFEADAPDAADLRRAMAAEMQVDVPVLLLPAAEIITALEACRWPSAGKLVHVFFCFDDPQVDTALRDQLIAPDEAFIVQGRRAWIHAPSGVARSKLMGKIDKVLGVSNTARNLNTLNKLADMVRA